MKHGLDRALFGEQFRFTNEFNTEDVAYRVVDPVQYRAIPVVIMPDEAYLQAILDRDSAKLALKEAKDAIWLKNRQLEMAAKIEQRMAQEIKELREVLDAQQLALIETEATLNEVEEA